MKMKKYVCLFLTLILLSSCNDKKTVTAPEIKIPADTITLKTNENKDEIEGIYTSEECDIYLKITKDKNGYVYFLKTSARKVNGKAVFAKQESGENYLTLEGLKWDDYEGDISNEEENDSISESKTPAKEIEIPIGIDAYYVKDTLTIQNYGNAMNSYTKLSECGLKFIQLIKK